MANEKTARQFGYWRNKFPGLGQANEEQQFLAEFEAFLFTVGPWLETRKLPIGTSFEGLKEILIKEWNADKHRFMIEGTYTFFRLVYTRKMPVRKELIALFDYIEEENLSNQFTTLFATEWSSESIHS